jgi:hypothetical protein
VALVSSLSLRIGVTGVEVTDAGRVLLTLPRGGETATQHLDLNLTTVPSRPEGEPPGNDPTT